MVRVRLHSLLKKWSRIRFTRIKVVRVPAPAQDQPLMELYLCDGREPAAWLFLCRLANVSEEQATVSRFTRWLEEYYQPQEVNYAFNNGSSDAPEKIDTTSPWRAAPHRKTDNAVMAGWQSQAKKSASLRTAFFTARN